MTKVILVTGANSYLFRCIMSEFVKKNIKVIITSRKKIKTTELKNSNNCEFKKLDVTKISSIKKMMIYIKKKYGKLDGVVNFAYSGLSGKIDEILPKDFYEATKYNLVAPFMLIQSSAKIFGEKKIINKMSFINISSVYGIKIPNFEIYKGNEKYTNPVHYGATKAGLIHMTKYLAKIYAKYGVRINCITPGAFPNNKFIEKNKNFKKKLIKQIPANRLGEPKDLLGVINFLLSDDSNYVTGSNYVVDGGFVL